MKTWKELSEIQPNVVKMITNSIRKDRVGHAYLFEGDQGTAKKEISVQFAKSLYCVQIEGVEPCGLCVECKRINSGNHPNVHYLAPDGNSLKKDQIRDLQREFSKKGVEFKRKIYIIEHVDRMTVQAANSLLKFLEEPSQETVALLLTEQVQQIIPTILSRCQIVTFKSLTPEHLVKQLLDQNIPEHNARLAASLTNNIEEALSIIEDDWFAQARNIVIQLGEMLKKRTTQAFFFIQDKWLEHFKEKDELDRGLDLLLLWYKDILYMQVGEEQNVIYTDQKDLLEAYSLHSPQHRILDKITAVFEAKRRLSANVNPQLLMEQLVLKLQEG